MSTTWIDMQKQDPVGDTRRPLVSLYEDDADDEPSRKDVPAMTIVQQLRSLKEWLALCDDRTSVGKREDSIHEECHKDDDLIIPAKRVLHLADAATGTVRVVGTTNLEGRYIALSHCWGPPERHPLMTTHATLKDHEAGIELASLPRSFRDAITVCRHLGVEYIWIDCLCIVQDDGYDPVFQRRYVLIPF